MTATEAISSRKSIRAYLDQPVSDDLLAKIIEAGRWAPNAGPFQISIVRRKDLLQRINDRTREAMINSDNAFARQRVALPGYQPLYAAPVAIFLSAPVQLPVSPFNAALTAENMILAATELGLGTCFLLSPARVLNETDNQDLAKEVGIPDGYQLQCAVLVGYAAAENKFSLGERKLKGTVNYVD